MWFVLVAHKAWLYGVHIKENWDRKVTVGTLSNGIWRLLGNKVTILEIIANNTVLCKLSMAAYIKFRVDSAQWEFV